MACLVSWTARNIYLWLATTIDFDFWLEPTKHFIPLLFLPMKVATLSPLIINVGVSDPYTPIWGYNIDDLPSSLRHDIFTAVEQRCSLKNRFSKEDQEIVFQAWRKYFCGKKLVLGDFLGEHWSSLVFQHIVCSSETFDDISCLELRSNEVNQV